MATALTLALEKIQRGTYLHVHLVDRIGQDIRVNLLLVLLTVHIETMCIQNIRQE